MSKKNVSARASLASASSAASRENYIFYVDLGANELRRDGCHPVTRTLSCPASMTFQKFHKALQIAFGWSSTHKYDFTIHSHGPEARCYSNCTTMLEIMDREARLEAEDFDDMPVATPFYCGRPQSPPTRKDSEITKLFQVFERPEYVGKLVVYEYDSGAGWEHHITVSGRAPASTRPVCLDGVGHGIAEDSGGFHGWQELVKAYRTETPNDEQRRNMRWYERDADSGDPEGLRDGRDALFDIEAVNRKLLELR